ncbi:MAG: hypothetical protein HY319_08550 [Armatimonadetes bacterium]|nr:hypothetical protein [Armatimonadota bacterium]
MKRLARALTALALLVVLAGPAAAGIFDFLTPEWETEGMVMHVQSNYFVMMQPENQFLRVMIPAGQRAPQNLVAGIRVKVALDRGNVPGEWWLDHFDYIQPIPGGPDPNR